VHGIMRVLEEIGRGRVGEEIGGGEHGRERNRGGRRWPNAVAAKNGFFGNLFGGGGI
jgi:hypothetical protein